MYRLLSLVLILSINLLADLSPIGGYERFIQKDIAPTGLLCGKRAKHSTLYAREIEKSFDEEINADGQRRYAWVFPDEISGNYKSQEAWYEFNFFLPKGSYATVLLEEIAKKEIK